MFPAAPVFETWTASQITMNGMLIMNVPAKRLTDKQQDDAKCDSAPATDVSSTCVFHDTNNPVVLQPIGKYE